MAEMIYNSDARKRIDRSVIWTESQRRKANRGGTDRKPFVTPRIAKITANNGSGDYDAQEVYWNGSAWTNMSAGMVFNSSNQGTVKELNLNATVEVDTIVELYPVPDTNDNGIVYWFDSGEPANPITYDFEAYYNGTNMTVRAGYVQIGNVEQTVATANFALTSDTEVWVEYTKTKSTGVWSVNSALQNGASIGDEWVDSSGTITWKRKVASISSEVITQHHLGTMTDDQFFLDATSNGGLTFDWTNDEVEVDIESMAADTPDCDDIMTLQKPTGVAAHNLPYKIDISEFFRFFIDQTSKVTVGTTDIYLKFDESGGNCKLKLSTAAAASYKYTDCDAVASPIYFASYQGAAIQTDDCIDWQYDSVDSSAATSPVPTIIATAVDCASLPAAPNEDFRDFEVDNSESFDVGDVSALKRTGDFAFSCWIKAESLTASRVIFNNGDIAGGSSRGMRVIASSAGVLNVEVYTSSGSSDYAGVNAGTISAGTWYSIIVNWDSTAKQVEAFIDNSSIGTDTMTAAVAYDSQSVYIGKGNSVNLEFDGLIGRMGYYNAQLDGTDRAAIHNSGCPLKYADMGSTQQNKVVSFWDLDEASGNATDAKASNDGTDTNTVGAAQECFGSC